ncbi:hypothetical protein GLOTRDRAFT_72924 [Gloeophyllum trabeum ATCC 11539]|uniref:RecA family profile 1 domain-containing protein n=1 Tax=Gloeophyllum trabeum (strain ATCC 11539 / FP-39264 / Madison 617) TaxID=670483 RepID=S7QGD2_GLOTA|nr:uncharacterized protein GLOTRDRAFT_72924 [Gloeophyllum trabeum ATCC 11539]EPQ58472.1 hypothetical protein GLOTRDRAFT_72924 [Gloeophyllum trabeum ATCC 11539]
MVWEIAGESAAGKTQIALQASLFVQLPMELRGLCGSACYLTTSSKLQTTRLSQIRTLHPALSSAHCGLSDIHTLTTSTLPILIHALSTTFPALLNQISGDSGKKPVKLLVIDALTELFHSAKKTTTNTLVERSKNISEISVLLHTIASEHQIAVLVLNEVVDVIDQGPGDGLADETDLVYRDQARWFNRADSIPGEDRKEAGLGLSWANQVNARIMCTRTNRHRNLHDFAHKRSRHDSALSISDSPLPTDSTSLVRRLTIIFSSVSAPTSLDYVVTAAGVFTVDDIASVSSTRQSSRKRTASALEECAPQEGPEPAMKKMTQELEEPLPEAESWADSDDLYPELDMALLDAAETEIA